MNCVSISLAAKQPVSNRLFETTSPLSSSRKPELEASRSKRAAEIDGWYERLKVGAASTAAVLLLLFFSAGGYVANAETISIIGEDSSNLMAMKTLAREYENSNKNVQIEIKGLSFDEALKASNQDLALGTGKFDIILQYNFTLASYVESNYVWKLKDLKSRFSGVKTTFEKDLFPNAWKEVGFYYGASRQPEAFGYPFAANSLLLVVNNRMFGNPSKRDAFQKKFNRELTPPKTWSEFKDLAEFFTDKGGQFGVVLQGASDGWLYYEFASILASSNIRILDKHYGWETAEDQIVNLAADPIRKAATDYISLKPFNAGDFKKTDAVTQRELMKQDNVAMAVMWSDYLPELASMTSAGVSQFSFFPLPGDLSPLAGGSFYINKKSRHAQASFQFLAWLLQPENQERMAKHGLASPSKEAYSNVVVNSVSYASALRTSIERGTYAFEANKDSETIQTAVTEAIQSAWDDPINLQKYLVEASKKINKSRSEIFTPRR
jgi:ABC-type glycerol-3-phosphate transport system substrate-binding protein